MITFGFVIPSFGPFTEPAAFADLVQAGEELGYHDVWFGDHVVVPGYAAHLTRPDWVDPLAACAFVLGHTTRLRPRNESGSCTRRLRVGEGVDLLPTDEL